jgi:uncharacterized protein
MSSEAFNASAARLCTSCGMCCDGTLFHLVRLQPSDSAGFLNSLGLKLSKKKGQHCFEQPCRMLKERQCTIYEGRPERCRLFECKLLKRLADGAITEAHAQSTIFEVRRQVATLLDLIEQSGHHNQRQPLTIRYERVVAEPVNADWDPEAFEVRQQLTWQMKELQKQLAAEFRPDSQPLSDPE